MSRRVLALVTAALGLTACDGLLGLHDITPDGDPVALTITAGATTGVVDQPLPVLTVLAVDVLGKPATKFTGEIRLKLGNNPSGAALRGAVTATAVGGTARFDLLGVTKPGSGYTLVLETDELPALTTAAFDINQPRFTPVATGTAGGPIFGLAISPAPQGGTATIYAGAGDGVYKSADGARTWAAANFGAIAQGIPLADPMRPGVVYLRTQYGSQLKKTTDGGATWRTLGDSLYLNAFAIDPRDSSVLYGVTNGSDFERSSDGGATWSKVGSRGCRAMAVDAVTAGTLYCAQYDSNTGNSTGIARSTDGGANWQVVNTGLMQPYDTRLIIATPTGVFAFGNNQVYRSTNAGDQWTVVSAAYAYSLAAAPSQPSRVYLASGGVQVSNNGGATFDPPVSVAQNDYVQNVTVDPTDANHVYAAGNNGIYVSTNGGASWAPSSTGIDAHSFNSVVVTPGSPGSVVATTQNTIVRGANGTAFATTAQTNNVTVHLDPDVATRMYQCGYNYFATSTDSGATYTGGVVTGLETYCVRLAIAGTTMYAAGYSGLYKSTNRGAAWAKVNLPDAPYIYDVAIGDPTGTIVVVATAAGLYRSTNGGGTFTKVSDRMVSKIVADPTLTTRLVALQCPGLLLSINAGESFASTGMATTCAQQLEATGGALYAAGYDNLPTGEQVISLQRSTDGGGSWASVPITGVQMPFYVTGIAASSTTGTVYLATQAGLYKGSFD